MDAEQNNANIRHQVDLLLLIKLAIETVRFVIITGSTGA